VALVQLGCWLEKQQYKLQAMHGFPHGGLQRREPLELLRFWPIAAKLATYSADESSFLSQKPLGNFL
jgi:hypothetical protein